MNRFKIDLGKIKLDYRLLGDFFFLTGAALSMYYMMSHLLGEAGDNGKSKEYKKKGMGIFKRIQHSKPELKNVKLNEYERSLLNFLVMPEEITATFNDIGGLEKQIEEIREAVILPLTEPELFTEHLPLLHSPNGVLLYGPPGCGKTMMAKAIAKESGAFFLLIRMSTIMDKWYGESNKIVEAIFSLANKLQPCIIFIDEIDSFLRDRSSNDHEVSALIKAEFMTLWDGLLSNGRIMVLGATNRPGDIDQAFLRRMPKRLAIEKPGPIQRKYILEKILRDSKVDRSDFELNKIVSATEGYTGSDLRELSREAALISMREYIRDNYKHGKKVSGQNNDGSKVRPLRTSDFVLQMEIPVPNVD